MPLLLGIDDGTSAVKVIAYDLDLRPVAAATRPVPVHHPGPGLVEQHPDVVLDAVIDAVASVLDEVDGTVVACGIDHQGESVLAWDADTGRPRSPILVWQDKRGESVLAALDEREATDVVRLSGLPLDPYLSAASLAWLMTEGGLGDRADVRLGTVDAYLSDRLGAGHATDPSTASRTQLSGVVGAGVAGWDDRLLSIFGVPSGALPEIMDSAGDLGTIRHPRWRQELPLRARVVDQQAALAGTGCVHEGQVKATFGTGVFVLAHMGERQPHAEDLAGVLPTVAWRIAGRTEYALDGGVFTAGALLAWLGTLLGLGPDPRELMDLARSVPDSAGVRMLPALAGLGAPWWRPDALGLIEGLGLHTTRAHIARAAVDAIVWRVTDIVAAIGRTMPVVSLRMDGGASADPQLGRWLADATGATIERMDADATCAGAAGLAAVGAGIWSSTDEIAARVRPLERFVAGSAAATRAADHEAWTRFVERALD